jgi:hypothetical protein
MDTKDAERILKFIADSMEEGKEFVVAQAPDVVQQMVAREIWVTGLQLLLAVIAIACCVTAAVKLTRLAIRWARALDGYGEEVGPGVGAIFAGMIGSFLTLYACDRAVHLVSVLVAPKVFILEQAANLLR